MFDFSNLSKLSTSGKTAEMELPLEGAPVLVLRPADESNSDYWNALLKVQAAKAEKFKRGQKLKVDVALLTENRRLDANLFPRFVIADWRGIRDAAGNEVAFSEPACKAFIEQLVEHAPRVFDEIRAFAASPESFLGEDGGDPDVEALLGN